MPAPPRPRAVAAAILALLLVFAALLPAGAQTPVAGEVSAQACAGPGAVPVVAGAPGGEAVSVAETTDGITLTLPDDTAHELPGGELRFAPGMAVVLAADGTHTVLGAATGETWTFAPVAYSDFQSSMNPATAPFVQTGPYVAGPIAEDGLDWQIVDTRTGDSVTTGEIFGGPLPVAADATALPEGEEVAAIRFRQMAEPIAGPGATPQATYVNVGATLVIPGDLAGATFIDLDANATLFHDADPMLFPSNLAAVFNADRTQVAWATGSGDPFGNTHQIHVASIDALDTPTTLATPGSPDGRVPVLFTPDGSALLALIDGALTRIDLGSGEATPANAPDLTAAGIRLDNPVDGTIIYDTGSPEQPQAMLYDAATDATTALPELDAYPWIFPLAGWTWAGATGGMGDTGTTVLVDTRTGQVAAAPPESDAQAGGGTLAGDFRDGILVTARVDGTALVQHGQTGEAWVMPMPAEIEPGLVPRITISPSADCLLVVTTTPGSNLPFGSWVAPLAPDGAWTAQEPSVLGWWQLAP